MTILSIFEFINWPFSRRILLKNTYKIIVEYICVNQHGFTHSYSKITKNY